MDFKKTKEDSNAVKSDLARIDFDFDFDFDIGGSNANNADYEKEVQKIMEDYERQEKMGSHNQQSRKKLTPNEREVISEIFKSQTDSDILSICEDVIVKSKGANGKQLIQNVLGFLDQIGLFGDSNQFSDMNLDFDQYFSFVEKKYKLKMQEAKENVPLFVKAFYEYLLIHY